MMEKGGTPLQVVCHGESPGMALAGGQEIPPLLEAASRGCLLGDRLHWGRTLGVRGPHYDLDLRLGWKGFE